MVTHREFYIIFDIEQEKYLDSLGNYFLHFERDPWFALKYDTKDQANKVINGYGLSEVCILKKIKLEIEVVECDTSTK